MKTSLEEIMRSNRIEYSSITSMTKRLLSRFNAVALVITTFVDGESATEFLNIVIYKSFPPLDTDTSNEFLMTKTIWNTRNVFYYKLTLVTILNGLGPHCPQAQQKRRFEYLNGMQTNVFIGIVRSISLLTKW